jgi:hypothetical protein
MNQAHRVRVTLLLWSGLAAMAWGQLYTGTISGVVHDPSGAVIPGATVTLTEVNQGFTHTASSDGAGRYTFRSLSPSTYSLNVQATGFNTFQQNNIPLEVNGNATVDVNLRVATAGQTVEVSDTAAPQLQTEDAVTGQTLNRRFINDLPLIGRQVFDLAFLAPGVSQAPGTAYGAGGIGNNFVSDGQRNAQSDILIDGVSTTNYEQNTGFVLPLYTPSVDAVQEFRLEQTNFSAEIGFSAGTVVNVVTRSGTNQIHGSLYEFFRNTDLNANSFFANAAGQPTPAYHWNNYGGTVGGPIKKDRVFYFFDYEGHRQITPTSLTLGVPSQAERTGNFGELCQAHGGAFNGAGLCSANAGQLWDPYLVDPKQSVPTRTTFVPFNNLATYASPGNPKTPWITPGVRGNLINPAAQKIAAFFPLPNLGTPGAPGYNPFNNFFGSASNTNNSNQFDAKVDTRLTDVDMLNIKLSHGWGDSHGANLFGNVLDSNTQGPIQNTVYAGALNYTHTFSPTTVLTASAGYTHSWVDIKGIAADFQNFSLSSLGLPSNLSTSGFVAPPAIQIGSYAAENGNANIGGQPWSGLLYGQDVWHLIGSVSHIMGGHELKVGGEFRVHKINFTQFGLPAGLFNFQQSGTSQVNSVGGDAMASFLVGFPTGWSAYEIPPSPATQNFQYSGFVQDNWHVNSKLTLNLGLRYDIDQPRTERHNQMSYFDPSAASPVQGVTATPDCPACGNIHGTLQYVGVNGNPRTPYNTYWGAIGPRLGLAYRLGNSSTLRMGYGIYYDPSKGGAAGLGSGAAGFQGYDAQTTFASYQGDNITPNFVISNPQTIGLPTGNSQGTSTSIGGSLNGVPIRNYNVLPQEQSWSFGIQHQMPWSILLDAEYVGRKGTHLYFGGDTYALDHLPAGIADAFRANPNAFLATVPIPAGLQTAVKQVTPPFSNGVWGGTWQAYNGFLPYPQYPNNVWGSSALQNVDPPIGNSIYHSLQLRIEKRFSDGLQFLTTYTMQKSIDDSSLAGSNVFINGTAGASLARVQDPNNLRLERSLSQFDVSQIAQFSFVYQLPYGRGKRWGGSANKLIDGVLGGWQTNGIYRWDTGLPILLFLNGGVSLPTYGNQRANLTGPLHKSDGTNITQYFANPQVAVAPPAYFDGNAPRVLPNVRAPGTNNLSASLFKNFPLGFREGASLQFRAEGFNVLNRVQFAAPNSTVGLSNFGVITGQANSPRQLQLALKLYF